MAVPRQCCYRQKKTVSKGTISVTHGVGYRHISADGIVHITALGNVVLHKFLGCGFFTLFARSAVDVIAILHIADGLCRADTRVLFRNGHLAVIVRINSHGNCIAAFLKQRRQISLYNRQLFKQAFVQSFDLGFSTNQFSPVGRHGQLRFQCFRETESGTLCTPCFFCYPIFGTQQLIAAS